MCWYPMAGAADAKLPERRWYPGAYTESCREPLRGTSHGLRKNEQYSRFCLKSGSSSVLIVSSMVPTLVPT